MEPFVVAIGVAIFAGLFGGLVTFLFQNYFSLIKEDVEVINEHIKDIDRIETNAVKYWLNDAEKNPEQEIEYAALLLGCVTASSCFADVAKRIMGSQHSRFIDLDVDLYEATTGGGFQAADRKVNTQRTIQIMASCNELRALLRKVRRSMYWAR